MFLNFEHQKRFIEWQRRLPNYLAHNRNQLALILLISGNDELERKVSPFYDPEQGNFAVDDMIAKEDFSSNDEILVRLAAVVSNQRMIVNIHEISQLDARNRELALNVLRFRYQEDDLSKRLKLYQKVPEEEGRTIG